MLRHSLTRLAGLALVPVALAFAGAAPVLAEAPSDSQPTLMVSASDTPDWFDVQADVRGDENFSYYLTGPHQETFGGRSHTARSDGLLEFNFKMPRAAEAGQWTITLQGDKADELVGTFTATAQAPDVELSVSEGQAAAGTALFITSDDVFKNHEPTSYWLTDPAGNIVQGGIVDASKRGKLDLSLMVGTDLPRGIWTLIAYGWDSDHYGSTPITIS